MCTVARAHPHMNRPILKHTQMQACIIRITYSYIHMSTQTNELFRPYPVIILTKYLLTRNVHYLLLVESYIFCLIFAFCIFCCLTFKLLLLLHLKYIT